MMLPVQPVLLFLLALAWDLVKGVTIAPVITLSSGVSLRGSVASSGTVNTFLGIPYAMPPVNDRRWAPPEPWTSNTTSGTVA